MVRKIVCIIFAALTAITGVAQVDSAQSYFEKGNELYQGNNYEKAEKAFLQCLDYTDSNNARAHFNLGNTYFKLNQIGLAVLHYEKALKQNPDYEKATYNLTLARARVVDEVEASPSVAFYNRWERILTAFGASSFAIMALALLLVAVGGFYFFVTGGAAKMRKSGFAFMIVFLVLFAMSTYLSYAANDIRVRSEEAIITQLKIDVKTEPKDNAATAFVLHEGAKVGLVSEVDGWLEIKLDNGNMGWLPESALAAI